MYLLESGGFSPLWGSAASLWRILHSLKSEKHMIL